MPNAKALLPNAKALLLLSVRFGSPLTKRKKLWLGWKKYYRILFLQMNNQLHHRMNLLDFCVWGINKRLMFKNYLFQHWGETVCYVWSPVLMLPTEGCCLQLLNCFCGRWTMGSGDELELLGGSRTNLLNALNEFALTLN